jgi:hypothetical protein
MPAQRGDSDRSGNCRPGTIVDTEIVVPQEFDFCKRSDLFILRFMFELLLILGHCGFF